MPDARANSKAKMLLYPQLIGAPNVGGFWQSFLERLSIGEAPYLSLIEHDILRLDSNDKGVLLTSASAREVIDHCARFWNISSAQDNAPSWKEIRKEGIKILLLQRYVQRQYAARDYERAMLSIYLQIATKQIRTEQIFMKQDVFEIDYIK